MLKIKPKRNFRQTRQTAKVAAELHKILPTAEIDVYRYTSVAIRIRIISESFADMNIVEREKVVWPTLGKLDYETRADLSLLLMFTPEEVESGGPIVNLEFDRPTATRW